MKRLMLILSSLAAAAAVPAAGTAGAVTFDFEAGSRRMFGTGQGAGNLIRADAWKSLAHVHLPGLESDREFTARVAKFVRMEAKDGAFLIETDAQVKSLFKNPNDAVSVSGSFNQDVILPDDLGGTYRFSLEFQQRRFDGLMGGAFIQPYRSDGTYARKKPLRFKFTNNAITEWFPYSGQVVVPAGCDRVSIALRLYSVGVLRVRDVSLVRTAAETPIVLRQSAHGVVDPSFAIGSNQCGYINWEWKKADPAATYKAKRLRFVLDLPKGFEFMEASFASKKTIRRECLPDGSTRISFTPGGRCLTPEPEFNSAIALSAFVRTSAPAGTEGMGRLKVEYDGKLVSNVLETRYFAVPEVKARVPRRYRNGIRVGWCDYTEGEAVRAYARMAVAAGARWVVPSLRHSYNGERFSTWREAGFDVITPQTGDIKNGFYVGKWQDRPESDRFKSPDPTFELARRSTCPAAVYEERPHFMTNTVPWLRKTFAGTDGIWANWEPHFYFGRGCFCDQCRAKFAEFAGITDEAMKADWPQELAYGRKWHALALKFRAREHGKLVRTLARHIADATGGEGGVGFMPGISWGELGSTAGRRGVSPEVKASEYVPALKWIDPWGPYPRWNYSAPYVPRDGFNVETFLAARDTREQIDREYPLPNRPKLLAFPQGYQPAGIVQPEWLALSLDSFFFNGWEASVVYHFPCGYDARYWQAFAAATSRAADCENYVLDGVRADSRVQVKVDPDCELLLDNVCAFLPDLQRVSALQTVAYDLGSARLVALLNFRDRTDMRLTLAQRGLSGSYRLKIDGRLTPEAYSPADLSRGIRLTAPAARTTVLEFVPDRN